MSPRRLFVPSIAAIAIATAVGLAVWQPWQADALTTIRPNADDAALVALGRDVYAAQCASCHGAQLEGQTDWRRAGADGRIPAPPHDASGHTWHHDDATLVGIVRLGTRAFTGRDDIATDMAGFADRLSEREIAATIAFIKSTWPAAIRARQAAITERARADGARR